MVTIVTIVTILVGHIRNTTGGNHGNHSNHGFHSNHGNHSNPGNHSNHGYHSNHGNHSNHVVTIVTMVFYHDAVNCANILLILTFIPLSSVYPPPQGDRTEPSDSAVPLTVYPPGQ